MDIDTRNSLLYVVELAVGKEYSDAYLRFLEEFVERVLEIDGFQRAQVRDRHQLNATKRTVID